MDIRIEVVAGDPPTWKVFLGTFFWSCESLGEAVEWASKAASHVSGAPSTAYRLPAPPAAAANSHDGDCGKTPRNDYIKTCPVKRDDRRRSKLP